jgi:hypothetical protein
MEIDEVAARILRRYWRLLLVTVLVPVALVGLLLRPAGPPAYTSQARLVASDTLPTSTAEADAVVSETRGFATSRNVLADAISDAHADRQAGRGAAAGVGVRAGHLTDRRARRVRPRRRHPPVSWHRHWPTGSCSSWAPPGWAAWTRC